MARIAKMATIAANMEVAMRKDRGKARGYDPELWKTRSKLHEEINTLAIGLDVDIKHLERLRATLADWDEREHAKKKKVGAYQDNIGGLVRGIIHSTYKVVGCHESGDEEQLKKCLSYIRHAARRLIAIEGEPLEEQYTHDD